VRQTKSCRRTGVKFINILRARFSYKTYNSALRIFSLVTFWLWQKEFGKKKLLCKKRKMLMKLTIALSKKFAV